MLNEIMVEIVKKFNSDFKFCIHIIQNKCEKGATYKTKGITCRGDCKQLVKYLNYMHVRCKEDACLDLYLKWFYDFMNDNQ
jgi:hypothetical protein